MPKKKGFRSVVRYPLGAAYDQKELLESQGVCGVLELVVSDDSSRHLYVMFKDQDVGWVPHAKLLTPDFRQAIFLFDTLFPEIERVDRMVKHISSALCWRHRETIVQIPLSETPLLIPTL